MKFKHILIEKGICTYFNKPLPVCPPNEGASNFQEYSKNLLIPHKQTVGYRRVIFAHSPDSLRSTLTKKN